MASVSGDTYTDMEIQNTNLLIEWLSTQILAVDTPSRSNVPDNISNMIRNIQDGHMYLPVFQRLIYSHAYDFRDHYQGNIVSFFEWMETTSSHMNVLYMVFGFSKSDVSLLRRSEFSVYQGYVKSIWSDLLDYFSYSDHDNDLYLVSKILMKVNMLTELDNLVFELSKIRIVQKVDFMYNDGPIYAKLCDWVDNQLFVLFESLLPFASVKTFKPCLLLLTKNALIRKRVQQIYTLVENYPLTIDSLKEINTCINKQDQKEILVAAFVKSLENKLLLPSIKTIDIIIYYIKTIHSYLLIDHRGVLLDKVARPIRAYLCNREDTIERIVDGLLCTDARTNKLIELNEELNKSLIDTLTMKSTSKHHRRTLNWQPDPVDALPDFKIGKIDDIIDSLTSIFEDNNLFINQFVKLFSVNLLNIENYDYSDILRNLSLLKTKFTDNDFNRVDIMLNDIKKSKYLDAKIHELTLPSTTKHTDIHGVFLSHLYWPNLSLDTPQFEFPDILRKDLAIYEMNYKKFQKGRKLKLHPQKSLVDVEITINGSIREYRVTLDRLAVLNLINESKMENMKIGIIMMKLKMPLQLIKASLEFWVDENVLIQSNGGWKMNE